MQKKGGMFFTARSVSFRHFFPTLVYLSMQKRVPDQFRLDSAMPCDLKLFCFCFCTVVDQIRPVLVEHNGICKGEKRREKRCTSMLVLVSRLYMYCKIVKVRSLCISYSWYVDGSQIAGVKLDFFFFIIIIICYGTYCFPFIFLLFVQYIYM